MRYKGKDYSRVCNVGTVYGFLLYLCYSSLDEIRNTFFIFCAGIPASVCKILHQQSVKYFESIKRYRILYSFLVHTKLLWVYRRAIILFKIPRIKKTDMFFAQDNLHLSSFLCSHDYIFIEESPFIFSNIASIGVMNRKIAEIDKNQSRLRKFLYGPANGLAFGLSKHCKKLLLTQDDPSKYVRNIPRQIVNFRQMWEESSDEKKQFILSIFCLTNDDTRMFRNRDIVIFTQPLYPDFFTRDEAIDIYKRTVQKYPVEKLIIKSHPRDLIDYTTIFPGIPVFSKPVPMQLLDLIGIHFKKVVTVNSTVVYTIDYPVDIDWYGNNEYIEKRMGHVISPNKVNICNL